jgi:hypothetical protein
MASQSMVTVGSTTVRGEPVEQPPRIFRVSLNKYLTCARHSSPSPEGQDERLHGQRDAASLAHAKMYPTIMKQHTLPDLD